MVNFLNNDNDVMILIYLNTIKSYCTLLRVADNCVMVLLKLMYLKTYEQR